MGINKRINKVHTHIYIYMNEYILILLMHKLRL